MLGGTIEDGLLPHLPSPKTGVGEPLSAVVPSPSWPYAFAPVGATNVHRLFINVDSLREQKYLNNSNLTLRLHSPQQRAVPSLAMPQELSYPPASRAIQVPPPTTGTGTVLSVVLPSPSLPLTLEPACVR